MQPIPKTAKATPTRLLGAINTANAITRQAVKAAPKQNTVIST